MKKYVLIRVFLLSFSTSLFGASTPSSIRLFNWWEYLSPETVARLNSNGFPFDLTVYKTNEIAISRLAKNADHFDVAVVSNLTIDVLRELDLIERGAFTKTAH